MAGNNHRKPRPLISDDEIVRRQLASAAAKIGAREPLSLQPPERRAAQVEPRRLLVEQREMESAFGEEMRRE